LRINEHTYTINIDGEDALIYSDLIKEINYQFILLENPFISPEAPNTDGYYFDNVNYRLFIWNGSVNIEQDLVISSIDPSTPVLNSLWYNPETKILYLWNGVEWVVTEYISQLTDPTLVDCNSYWYDGVDIWSWDGNHWCKLCIYSQERNPVLGLEMNCGSYWFDTTNNEFFSWNQNLNKWDDRLVLASAIDPNDINTGDFWYDETAKRVKTYIGGVWNDLAFTRYEEPNDEGELDNPGPNIYWFIPSQQKLLRRNTINTAWVEQLIVSYPTDPRDRVSCDLWWNTSTSADDLFAWDAVNTTWVTVLTFYKTPLDPTLPSALPDCAVWFQPSTNQFRKVVGVECSSISPIISTRDPTTLTNGIIWFDGTTWREWVSEDTEWTDIIPPPIVSLTDPTILTIDDHWYNPDNDEIRKWNGSSWDLITYSLTPLSPQVGDKWYNTVDEILLEWNGIQWVPVLALAYAEFVEPPITKPTERSKITFYTKDIGCRYGIELLEEGTTLFAALTPSVIYQDHVLGTSGLVAGTMTQHLGVGTDGSPDERRELHEIVRTALGYPTVQVELTKDQIDSAINYALNTLRKYSGYGYERVWFFMNMKPNQQTYIMTNKCVGYNKIVSITSLHRIRAGAFRSSVFQTDVHSYAALQSLYSAGTFDLLSFHLVASYVELLEELFASNLMFSWKEKSRELRIHQIVKSRERILVDAVIEKTEQDLLTNRNTMPWIRGFVIAECKLMISQVRGKFQQLPGPNGSTTLNSQELITQGESEKAALMESLHDLSMQNIDEHGIRSHMILG
jgi:hypothetical protein